MEKVNKTIISMMKYVTDDYFKNVFDKHGTFKPPLHYSVEDKENEADDLSVKIFDLKDMYSILYSKQINSTYKEEMESDFLIESYQLHGTGTMETYEMNDFRNKLLKYFTISEAISQNKDVDQFARDLLMRIISDNQIIYLHDFCSNLKHSHKNKWSGFNSWQYASELEGIEGIDKLVLQCKDYVKKVLVEYLVEILLDMYNGETMYPSIILETYLHGKADNDVLKGNISCFPEHPTINKIVSMLGHKEISRIVNLCVGNSQNNARIYVENCYKIGYTDKSFMVESDDKRSHNKK